jgi:hypothetical protein
MTKTTTSSTTTANNKGCTNNTTPPYACNVRFVFQDKSMQLKLFGPYKEEMKWKEVTYYNTRRRNKTNRKKRMDGSSNNADIPQQQQQQQQGPPSSSSPNHTTTTVVDQLRRALQTILLSTKREDQDIVEHIVKRCEFVGGRGGQPIIDIQSFNTVIQNELRNLQSSVLIKVVVPNEVHTPRKQQQQQTVQPIQWIMSTSDEDDDHDHDEIETESSLFVNNISITNEWEQYLLSLKRNNDQYDQLRSAFPNDLIFQKEEKDKNHCCVCPAGNEDFLPRFLCPGCNRSNATLFDRTSTTATTKALLTTALTSNYKCKFIEWSFADDDEWIHQAFSTFHYVFEGIDDK